MSDIHPSHIVHKFAPATAAERHEFDRHGALGLESVLCCRTPAGFFAPYDLTVIRRTDPAHAAAPYAAAHGAVIMPHSFATPEDAAAAAWHWYIMNRQLQAVR